MILLEESMMYTFRPKTKMMLLKHFNALFRSPSSDIFIFYVIANLNLKSEKKMLKILL